MGYAYNNYVIKNLSQPRLNNSVRREIRLQWKLKQTLLEHNNRIIININYLKSGKQ